MAKDNQHPCISPLSLPTALSHHPLHFRCMIKPLTKWRTILQKHLRYSAFVLHSTHKLTHHRPVFQAHAWALLTFLSWQTKCCTGICRFYATHFVYSVCRLLESTQLLTEISTRSISWVKVGRCVRLTNLYIPTLLWHRNVKQWAPLPQYIYIYIITMFACI